MASRSREKMAAAFRRLFRSSDKSSGSSQADKVPGAVSGAGAGAGVGAGSPVRRPRRGDAVGQTSVQSCAVPPPTHKAVRTRRLMKELRDIEANENPIFTVSLVNDNLYEWHVRLHRCGVDGESELAADMRRLAVPHVLLHLVFPDTFPFAPPFMRVVSPPIERGFVLDGGAICMELLTPRGWASAYTVEAILMQFAASLVKGQGRIARKSGKGGSKDFSRRSAEETFRSLVKTHDKYGWVTPPLSDG